MIGVSLPLAWLAGAAAPLADPAQLLPKLKERGVRSVELRTVRATHRPETVYGAARLLWEHGFSISVHGEVKSEETAVEDVFFPLGKVLSALGQPRLNITIHPLPGDNERVLHQLADHIEKHAYPVTIALENNRLLPDHREGDSAAFVWNAVAAVDRKCIGICFDFGHYLYYRRKNHPDEPFVLPPSAFFQRVIHTHIHALNGLNTHFPLGAYSMPLEDIWEALSHEYFGLYNIELDFPRFQELHAPEAALLDSVTVLRESLPACARLYDRISDSFDRWFLSACSALEGDSGTKFGLIHASSYLFSTDGYRWAVDVAFRNAYALSETPGRCAELLKELDLMVISHAHADHFEQATVTALADLELSWIIPDFLYDAALEYGISPNRIHIARPGQPLTVGPLTLTPFPGRHYRPGTTMGTPEYGYFVTAENGPSIVFPMDVRDFSPEGVPALPDADYCFAHVWLGDGCGEEASFAPLDSRFAQFMLKFSSKHIFLTHLYENGRLDRDMWRRRHAELLKAKIEALSSCTRVTIPQCGQVFSL